MQGGLAWPLRSDGTRQSRCVNLVHECAGASEDMRSRSEPEIGGGTVGILIEMRRIRHVALDK